MPTIFDRVIVLNLVANTAIFYVAARLYLLPLVSRLRPQQILVPILLLHSTRHLGMMFLTRGATYPGLPPEFAYPAAFGDLLTAIFAFLAIPLVLRGSPLARPFVWTFNIFGTVDLLAAITMATIYNAPVAMGPTYCIPAFWVPLLLVTHYVTFVSSPTPWGADTRTASCRALAIETGIWNRVAQCHLELHALTLFLDSNRYLARHRSHR